MENNEQNNIAATNNVDSANNVQPTPVVNQTPEVKPENTIMVAEPAQQAVEPATVEPTPAQPTVAPVEPTVETEPVVIPKGEKPKRDKKKPNPILILLALILLAGVGYVIYTYYIAPTIEKNSTQAPNNNGNDTKQPDEDVAIDANLVVKNQKNVSVDSKTTEYTYDIYLGDKLVVGNLTYSIIGASSNDANITLTKIGYLKDTVTSAKYYAFSVKKAPVAMSGNYLFIIDKDGNVVFRREGSTTGTTYIKELDEYVAGTSYKIDETENKLLYYVENGNSSSEDFKIEVKSVQISSGKAIDSQYKVYNVQMPDTSVYSDEIYGYAILNNNVLVELRGNTDYVVASYDSECDAKKCIVKKITSDSDDKYVYYIVEKYNGDDTKYPSNATVFSYNISSREINQIFEINSILKDTNEIYNANTVRDTGYPNYILNGNMYFASWDKEHSKSNLYKYDINNQNYSVITFEEYAKNMKDSNVYYNLSKYSDSYTYYFATNIKAVVSKYKKNGASLEEYATHVSTGNKSSANVGRYITYGGEKICNASENETCYLMYSFDKDYIYFMKGNISESSVNSVKNYYKYDINNKKTTEIDNTTKLYNITDVYLGDGSKTFE